MKILFACAISLSLLLAPIGPAIAQAPPPPAAPATEAPSPEALAVAKQLFSLVSGSMISDLTSKMTGQMWPSIESSLRTRYPAIDAATLTDLRQHFEATTDKFVNGILAQAPAIYARNFTAAEMRDIIAFYKTPTGAKTLKVMPEVSAQILNLLVPQLPVLQQQIGQDIQTVLKAHGVSAK